MNFLYRWIFIRPPWFLLCLIGIVVGKVEGWITRLADWVEATVAKLRDYHNSLK